MGPVEHGEAVVIISTLWCGEWERQRGQVADSRPHC